MATPQANLIRRIERHCRCHQIAATTFGRHAVNDGKLIARLRNGRSITLATLRRIEAALNPVMTRNPTAEAASFGAKGQAAGGRRGTRQNGGAR